jgi:phosphoribosylformylglycinamidine cyclo-ligase
MLRTFNCGIGMAVVAAPDQADAISANLTETGETVFRIGEIAAAAKDQAEVRIENVSSAWGW